MKYTNTKVINGLNFIKDNNNLKIIITVNINDKSLIASMIDNIYKTKYFLQIIYYEFIGNELHLFFEKIEGVSIADIMDNEVIDNNENNAKEIFLNLILAVNDYLAVSVNNNLTLRFDNIFMDTRTKNIKILDTDFIKSIIELSTEEDDIFDNIPPSYYNYLSQIGQIIYDFLNNPNNKKEPKISKPFKLLLNNILRNRYNNKITINELITNPILLPEEPVLANNKNMLNTISGNILKKTIIN